MPGSLSPLLRPARTKLWRPGQNRPPGIPQIDWTHPLTQKLISYWFPFGNSGYIDLVTYDVTKKGTGAKNTFPVLSGSQYGPGPGFTAGTSFCESTNLATIQSWTAPYSFAAGWYQLGAQGASGGWFALADVSGNDAFAIFVTASTTLGFSYGNTGSAFNFTTVANTFYVAVGAATGATTQASWMNGLAQTAGAATSAFSGSAMRYDFGDSTADGTVTTVNCNSVLYFGAAWSGRALSASDAALLYADPYCFLVPAEPEMMIIQSTAAAVVSEEVHWTIYKPQRRGWGH